LIENILAPTGITAKPSDKQFSDYLSRVKTLNKSVVNKILHEKIESFEEQVSDTKPIQVSFY